MSDRLSITGMTVSVDLKRSTYGQDAPVEGRFVSLTANVNGDPLSVEEAVVESLSLHLTAWKSILAAELAAGLIKNDFYNARVERLERRVIAIANALKEEPSEQK